VGELLNKIKKVGRDGKVLDKEEMAGELGDVLWYVSQLAAELGLDMDYIAEKNIKKLKDRMDRNALKGSGDNR
ncbi:MAG: nucleoside triphosphate pyrophosphohydrolase family protein, partial [Candidatus Micrarchaeota archaeon]|nr:nucleoside triphosphate pyrophosphohydrolase family protein [Candidatus Micrarchaeota archaeon]